MRQMRPTFLESHRSRVRDILPPNERHSTSHVSTTLSPIFIFPVAMPAITPSLFSSSPKPSCTKRRSRELRGRSSRSRATCLPNQSERKKSSGPTPIRSPSLRPHMTSFFTLSVTSSRPSFRQTAFRSLACRQRGRPSRLDRRWLAWDIRVLRSPCEHNKTLDRGEGLHCRRH